MNIDELIGFLTEITGLPGAGGHEHEAAKAVCRAFMSCCDEVNTDASGNVLARQRGSGPRVMLLAHLDEVFMMTLGVEDDGSVRFLPVGMADRILPAQRVTLLSREGPVEGIVSFDPFQSEKKGVRAKGMFIDTGLDPETVRRIVPVGTPVYLTGPARRLRDNTVCGKTLDDRACVAVLLACAREMQNRRHDADIVYALTAQEELNSLGALTGTYAVQPDLAIVLDVTHGAMENCKEGETFPLDASTLGVGPNLHRGLTALLREEAERLNMKVEAEVLAGETGTDAWVVQTAREGVPCALLSLPVKYMHSSVELGSAKLMLEQAHLLAQTLSALGVNWKEKLCC